MQKISVGFLVEVQLSVHFKYKYTNAIITNNTIQHTKETLWNTILHSVSIICQGISVRRPDVLD
jgi:hypothetical protein